VTLILEPVDETPTLAPGGCGLYGDRLVYVPVPGPQGPPGTSGGGGTLYTHHQTGPSASWLITHNLNTKPSVVLILDDDPTTPVLGDYTYPDNDSIVITLPAPATGWAYLT